MMPIVNIENMTDNDRAMLTSYCHHWNIIPRHMEVVAYRNGKPVCRPKAGGEEEEFDLILI